ncbi:MAG: T9SS type A sorting domain-containing protein [Chitinophagaceae bacterium]|nr:T9SS type A sorting domain-containing protein [Chitinophagaceae bacterium]
MKNLLPTSFRFGLILLLSTTFFYTGTFSQCTPTGDQTTYGTNDTWIGYAYQGMQFNTYKGFVNKGTAGNPNFDEGFGGNQVTYNTTSCSVYTDTFSMRYRLTKTFATGAYTFTVGGDDGYRLSLDGGATWVISNFTTHSYNTMNTTLNLSGSYNIVLEFYEQYIHNRITFNVVNACISNGDPNEYGTNNVWRGHIYSGVMFDFYKGTVNQGISSSPNFDQSFGGDYVNYPTSSCPVYTEKFSAKYRLRNVFATGTYTFTVGGDNGYRLSLDGGNTYVINNWNAINYTTTSYMVDLSGSRDMVIEYYENAGSNRVSFNMTFAPPAAPLPIKLLNWAAILSGDKGQLKWKTASAVNFSHFIVQRSNDGSSFRNITEVKYENGTNANERTFGFNDTYVISTNVFYRLAMVDKDGKTEYSEIIRLSPGSTTTETKMYPTIVEKGNIIIESSKQVNNGSLAIYTTSGTRISEVKVSLSNGKQQLNLGASFSEVSAGSYILILSDSNGVIAKKVIFIK